MQQIREYFERTDTLTDKDWQIFSSKLTKENFRKKTLILKEGQTENHLSFVEKGILRFYIPGEDKDITFAFAFENGFVSAYDSFLTRSPSGYCVETLQETTLWRLTYEHLQQIYAETSIGNTIGRHASETLFLEKSKRELSFLTKSAEQRWLGLLSDAPHLVRQIPLKYLASYIGITPQAISRIRKRIS